MDTSALRQGRAKAGGRWINGDSRSSARRLENNDNNDDNNNNYNRWQVYGGLTVIHLRMYQLTDVCESLMLRPRPTVIDADGDGRWRWGDGEMV